MNVLLWVLQVVLALHTAMGAMWKLSNFPRSLRAIPSGVWHAMSVAELVCVVALLLPAIPAFRRRLGGLVPLAAGFVVAEMLLFTALNLSSGGRGLGEITYWLVVAALCAFTAYGRFALKPLS
jgi:hypothetical protein